MILIGPPLRALAALNGGLLRAGRHAAWIALMLMVLAILGQVFFRYMIGNALAWSEELARFLMLWMVGLSAPSAYRWGGFVAIDMVPRALPRTLGLLLNLAILIFSLMVLVTACVIGWSEITGFGGRFASPSLWVPFNLDLATFELTTEWTKVAKKYMFASLWVGVMLMTLVNVELILRTLANLISPDTDIAETPENPFGAVGAD